MGAIESSIVGLSIILPAHQEAQGIGCVIDDICACDIGEYEIIVIDDGSEDKTGEIARNHGTKVIRHAHNRGYGAALKTGIRNAGYDLILIIDADGTYPCQVIPDLVDHLTDNQYDMVIGARVGENVSIPFVRKPAKWFITRLGQYVAGETILDINSGLRVFKRSIALHFFSALPDGFSFTTTITLGMLINHYKVGYLPINYYARIGKSKINPFRDTINIFRLIFRIALYFAPLKLFMPMSGFVFLLALGWGVFTHFVLGELADVSTLVIALAAFQIAMIGLLAELINHRLPNFYRQEE
jgi:glycosyltransferase involved in cell wall biosynthesis